MRTAIALAIALGSVSAAAAQSDEPSADERAAMAAFDAYKTSLMSRDGAAAMRVLLPSAAAFYEEARQAALSMPEPRLRRRGAIFRFTVLDLRHRHTKAEVRATTGAGILRQAISDGRVGSAVPSMDAQGAQVRGNRAFVRVGHTGSEATVSMLFRRHEGRWKLDLTHLMNLTTGAMEAQMSRLGEGDVNEGMLRAIETLVRRPVSRETIWAPLDSRD